jgi:acyl carrier protein phosphodiesterase
MNYLAHIYLSGDDDFIRIGNFIADGIKGTKYKKYSVPMQKGILLHREIDTFTDNNTIVKRSKRRLDDGYNLYRGIIIDILYDHFLAKNWSTYSTVPLEEYTQDFYDLLLKNFEILPDRIQHMMPYMIKDDWLTSYATLAGIKKVLYGMNKKTKERGEIHLAIHDLIENYAELEKDFTLFFQKLRNFCNLKLEEINKQYQ